ncbi:hypothetical protein EK904_000988, partial [Melospiza melodia maxima]
RCRFPELPAGSGPSPERRPQGLHRQIPDTSRARSHRDLPMDGKCCSVEEFKLYVTAIGSTLKKEWDVFSILTVCINRKNWNCFSLKSVLYCRAWQTQGFTKNMYPPTQQNNQHRALGQ